MLSSSNFFNLSTGLSELCFDKNEFMKPGFSVDEFLHEHRNAASLEVMRDDLGSYLKTLRLAMIELINHDYGDFVNLSNKLVGLNQYINNIRTSLEQLQINIEDIKMLLDCIMNEIHTCLEQKKNLIICKKNIRSLFKVQKSTAKLIDLLHSNHLLNYSSNQEKETNILERASLELMQSKFHAKFCQDCLDDELKLKVDDLNKKFLDKLRTYFLNILNNSNSGNSGSNNNNNNNNDDLEQCLRIYVFLDKCDVAEKVFQEKVGSYMETKINENRLHNSRDGLSEIYTEILNFISLHMKDILLLTYYTDKIKGFNFLINSYWNDVEHKLETNLSSIFAPGNPDNFYINYKCTQDFLKKFEAILSDEKSIKIFRKHELTKKFYNRWNLPVYFQIRFQEISGPIESNFLNETSSSLITSKYDNNSKILSVIFNLVLDSISKCWSDGVYIEKLFPKFLKLTLQIISRVCKHIEMCLLNYENNLDRNGTSSSTIDDIESIINIYLEIYKLINKLPDFTEIVVNKIPADIKDRNHCELINLCFENAKQQLNALLLNVENILVEIVLIECDKNIRQVGDIPRLYRKTNRDVPNKPSIYIQNVSNEVDIFAKKFVDGLQSTDKLNGIIEQILIKLTDKYCKAVQEVLTSVQKTEESLKRLKSLRDKMVNLKNSPERTTISDDDKIRLQLQLDVMYWNEKCSKHKSLKENVKQLQEIINLLEDVTKIKVNA